MTPLRDLVGRELKHGIQLPAWLDACYRSDRFNGRADHSAPGCVNVAAFAVAATALSHLVINSLH